ncbi:hypothetical protein P43SY_011765 [Pythium insidiosum]|uniref:Phosphate acetyl/butaryl transferase domain-containing protein n=1 Tax=Pythium insidiosum TaxID=114742 RepID=A0AAD5LVV3_PYTIN|nr:hypothetical protein P43SY_011765 [Pythium insidiosum]
MGPMLQGLRKPVNDLSRGATVKDIVTTVAITAIQADQMIVNNAKKSRQTAGEHTEEEEISPPDEPRDPSRSSRA